MTQFEEKLREIIEPIWGIPNKEIQDETISKIKSLVLEEVVGSDEAIPPDPNFDVVTYDSRISPRNQLRAEQRSKIEDVKDIIEK